MFKNLSKEKLGLISVACGCLSLVGSVFGLLKETADEALQDEHVKELVAKEVAKILSEQCK